MKLTSEELQQVRQQGVYVIEKCDGCGKVLNQCLRYTIKDDPRVFCCPACRDRAFLSAREIEKACREPRCLHCRGPKESARSVYCLRCAKLSPSTASQAGHVCLSCGASLEGKPADALYCDAKCKMRFSRRDSKTPIYGNSDQIESTACDVPKVGVGQLSYQPVFEDLR